MHGAADRASALPNTRRVISLLSVHKDSDYLLLLLLLLFIIILCSRGCALRFWRRRDVFRYFPPKKCRRTDETFRLDIGHCGLVQKKIEKKRDEKSSLTSDKNLEAEKERLPKSHEANCFSLLSLVSPLSCLSLLLTHLFFCLFVTTHQILTLFRT